MTDKPMDVERTLPVERLIEQHRFEQYSLRCGCSCGWRTTLMSEAQCRPAWSKHLAEILREALREPGALSQPTELLIRMFLWEGHGHNDQLYGDDGEMQCGVCRVDYKRDLLDVLVEHARVAALETGLKKFAASKQEPPAPATFGWFHLGAPGDAFTGKQEPGAQVTIEARWEDSVWKVDIDKANRSSGFACKDTLVDALNQAVEIAVENYTFRRDRAGEKLDGAVGKATISVSKGAPAGTISNFDSTTWAEPGAEAAPRDEQERDYGAQMYQRGRSELRDEVRAEAAPPTDCDLRLGHVQCSAKVPNGDDGHLCCRYVAGHTGKHKTCYDNGEEWEENVGAAVGESTGLLASAGLHAGVPVSDAEKELLGRIHHDYIEYGAQMYQKGRLAASQERSARDPICNYRVERWIHGVNHSWNCKRVFGHSGQHYSSPRPEDFGEPTKP